MGHQPRRRRARSAAVLLGVLLLAAMGMGRTPPAAGPLGQRSALADTPRVAGGPLDPRAAPIHRALNRARTRADLPAVRLDERLVESAVRDACAIARGEVALSGDRDRMTEAGGHQENTGLVIDDDPAAAAQAMHDWWTHTRTHRRTRLDPRMTRYGVGACNAENRTYYVERFAP